MDQTLVRIPKEEIDVALAGTTPNLGHSITQEELGKRLAPHRRGRYEGRPYGLAAVSLYRLHPEQQTPDFIEAFRSWRAAEILRQSNLRVRFNGLTVDELLTENGRIVQMGDGQAQIIIAVGKLPAQTLLRVNSDVETVEFAGEFFRCACGKVVAKRMHNQVRCTDCQKKRKHKKVEHA